MLFLVLELTFTKLYGIFQEINEACFSYQTKNQVPMQKYCYNCNVKTTSWGTEFFPHVGPKIWFNIPTGIKKLTFSQFQKRNTTLDAALLDFKGKISRG